MYIPHLNTADIDRCATQQAAKTKRNAFGWTKNNLKANEMKVKT